MNPSASFLPSRAASNRSASQVDVPEQAHDASAPGSKTEDIERQPPASPASHEHGFSNEPQLGPIQGVPLNRSPGDVSDALNDEPADTKPQSAANIPGQPTDERSQVRRGLSGWAGVEDHLFRHDTGEMKYHTEDIDTLLVFAGLFSAFLTAFVVQTYPMLTDDDSSTTNQLLALSVSMQLRATGTIIPSTVNSTLTSLLDAQPFSPPTSARAINTLFFLSLVLSLSAALFGILAKQWLREYLRWNSPLALPRENILVRQDRIEAWDAWNVGATISSIPALLEIAMVLFLCGVVVLLWTLDNIVAIIITVFAALFLIAASVFTVLPVVYKRCPYKSPTAWACVTACQSVWCLWVYCTTSVTARWANICREWRDTSDVISSRWLRLHHALRAGEQARSQTAWPSMASSWRERDLSSCREVRGKTTGTSYTRKKARVAVRVYLEEFTIPSVSGGALWTLTEWVLDEVAETALLVRALDWVKLSSQDIRVHAYIAECTPSRLEPHLPDIPLLVRSRAISAAYLVAWRTILLAMQQNLLDHPHSGLAYWDASDDSTAPRLGNRLSQRFAYDDSGFFPLLPGMGGLLNQSGYRCCFSEILLPMDRWDEGCTMSRKELAGTSMVTDLKRVIGRDAVLYDLLPAFDMCVILRSLAGAGSDKPPWYTEALHILFNVQSRFPTKFKNLRRSICLELAEYRRLKITSDNVLVFSDKETTTTEDAFLLLRWFDEDFGIASEGYLCVFFITATRWISGEQLPTTEPALLKAIFLKISTALDALVQKLPFETLSAAEAEMCGLINSLDRSTREVFGASQLRCAEFRRLAHACEGVAHRLETNYDIPFKLHFIAHAAHEDAMSCEETTGCLWLSHCCDINYNTTYPWEVDEKCPALRKIKHPTHSPPPSRAQSLVLAPSMAPGSQRYRSYSTVDAAETTRSPERTVRSPPGSLLQRSRTPRETNTVWPRRLVAPLCGVLSHIPHRWTLPSERSEAGRGPETYSESIALGEVQNASDGVREDASSSARYRRSVDGPAGSVEGAASEEEHDDSNV
ncbi:hypothetical protein PsYK624_136810 [Phanerochaete sordida]|uniref:DUF6535 domain-containing protein n=1 Tax=Phanerochaete sordida TaxID=48140 RepID=A0A9P3GM01_9APHY|nr:hypothetical protein PsYK624_136810 [Phanerochaete sordida]